ncbi:MAG: 2-dehydro-3-deoxyglucarate aldolase [Bryobacterales bacterium]|nr:2-dehydro-3-deoxyglucarate aldolase [Bryobacterales bacterium]
MFDIRRRVLNHDVLFGSFLNLGSALTAEIVAMAGFDFVLIDLEHGAGFEAHLLGQLQAIAHTGAAPIVRVESLDRPRFHRVLDLGAQGIMVPHVDTPEMAKQAVAAMRYPPTGVRGVAMMNRACGFGTTFNEYVKTSSQTLLGIMQIESPEAVENAEAIAEVDGVDVLFVGPLDLSHSLGITGQFDHPKFIEAVRKVARAAEHTGKMSGILMPKPEFFATCFGMGFRFLPCNSDGGMLNAAARNLLKSLQTAKDQALALSDLKPQS